MTLPNAFSWSRIWAASIVPVAFFFFRPPCVDCISIVGILRAFSIILIFLTDWLDGYFARKRDQQTAFGAKLDHVSDKILVSSLSLYFWFVEPALPLVFVLLLLAREWLIVFIRTQANVPVKKLGKIKFVIEGVAFTFLAAGLYTFGFGAYFFALVLAYLSAYFYVQGALAKIA